MKNVHVQFGQLVKSTCVVVSAFSLNLMVHLFDFFLLMDNAHPDQLKISILLWIISVIYVLCFFMLSHLFIAALLVTCWERADLLAIVCDFNCVFVTFPCGILGQVWGLDCIKS